MLGGGPRAPPLAAAAVCVPAAAHLAQTYRERPQSHPAQAPRDRRSARATAVTAGGGALAQARSGPTPQRAAALAFVWSAGAPPPRRAPAQKN